MRKKYKFEVVTPTGVFYQDDVEFIKFTAINGEMGILANHAPTLIANKASTLTIEKDSEEKDAFISEGFIEVTNEKVSVDVDMAIWAEEISDENALRDLRNAEEELEKEKDDNERRLELIASIERARAALKTASKHDKMRH